MKDKNYLLNHYSYEVFKEFEKSIDNQESEFNVREKIISFANRLTYDCTRSYPQVDVVEDFIYDLHDLYDVCVFDYENNYLDAFDVIDYGAIMDIIENYIDKII